MSKGKPPRPLRLLAALFEAQQHVGDALACTRSRNEPGWHYAGSDDVQRAARGALHASGLMVLPERTEIRQVGAQLVMSIVVSVHHMPSRQQIERSFEVDICERWGAASAARNGFALALQMLLNIPRRADEASPIPDREDLPRSTERVVLPAPVRPTMGTVEQIKLRCHELGLQLGKLVETTPRDWRAEAHVPLSGELSQRDLQDYATTLERLIWENTPGPDESGEHQRVPDVAPGDPEQEEGSLSTD